MPIKADIAKSFIFFFKSTGTRIHPLLLLYMRVKVALVCLLANRKKLKSITKNTYPKTLETELKKEIVNFSIA